MKALILGCGSIGMRHVGHLLSLEGTAVEAADPNPEICRTAESRFGIQAFVNPEEALARNPDCVLVCTPADSHVPVALQALEAGVQTETRRSPP